VAHSLQYIHRMHLLHSDVKLDNVLLKSDPSRPSGVTPKLADFGLVGGGCGLYPGAALQSSAAASRQLQHDLVAGGQQVSDETPRCTAQRPNPVRGPCCRGCC
jgi:serine/threonine protein kinase